MPVPNDRSTRIEHLVAEAVRSSTVGTRIDVSVYAERYPELMPELGQQLARLNAIEQAAESAEVTSTPENSESTLDPDVQFLRDALKDCDTLERIDSGGQGIIYKAYQRSTNRIVAVKILLDGPLATEHQKRRFAREIELAARLNHPNIAGIFETGEIRGRPYVVLEYIDGLSIDVYADVNALSVEEIVSVFLAVCDAVVAAHRSGIIHRDLKPANILVDADGRPHILDFGLAKDLWEETAEVSVSVTGQVIGSLPYLSPEQARGDIERVDIRSDVYSLGVVLYRLVTGDFPYPVDGSRQVVLDNILSCEPRKPNATLAFGSSDEDGIPTPLDDDLESVIMKALEKDPSRRYQSATSLADDLRRYVRGEAVEAKAANGLYQFRKFVRKFRVQVGVALAFVLVLVGALFAVAIQWQRAERIGQIAMTGLRMASLLKVGAVERDAGRLSQGIALFEKTLELGNTIQTTDPIVQRQRFETHQQLAELYLETNRPNEALEHCRQAIRIAHAMADADSQEPRWHRQVAFAYVLEGRLNLLHQRYKMAIDAFDKAEPMMRRLVHDQPQNYALQSDLAFVLSLKGKGARKLSRFDTAEACYTESHMIYERLAAAEPDVLGHKIDLTRADNKLAVLHISKRTPEDDQRASEWLSRASDRLQDVRQSPDSEDRLWDIDALDRDIDFNTRLVHERTIMSDR